jgi:glycosyltransferase involved in cell wall biosynthesis
MSASNFRPRVLFVITEDWFFYSHFLDRAKFIAASGGKVGIATRISVHENEFKDLGFELYPINFSRRGLNPITEFITALKIRRIVRSFKPDIAHNIALKPVVTGSFGELLGRQGVVINALVGMGYIFTSTDTRASVVKPILSRILKSLLRSKPVHVVIENPDDLKSLVDDGFVRPSAISLIRGAGVDLNTFPFHPEVAGPVVVTLVSRILRDKGVLEFIEAASQLQAKFPEVTFQIVGEPDPGNPSAISQSEIDSWASLPNVKYLGRRSDIADILQGSHIVCLPSYREGLPKSLLEALSSGRSIITTDVPGCREVCDDGVNGLLIPARDSLALSNAIEKLVLDPESRKTMGRAGRLRAESEFSNAIVCAQTLDLYRGLLNR